MRTLRALQPLCRGLPLRSSSRIGPSFQVRYRTSNGPSKPTTTLEPHSEPTPGSSSIVAEDSSEPIPTFVKPRPVLRRLPPSLWQQVDELDEALIAEYSGGKNFGAEITIRNDPAPPPTEQRLLEAEAEQENQQADRVDIPRHVRASLHVYPLVIRRVTQQTGKGKIHRVYALYVVGNGNGLVGIGEGKHEDPMIARSKAFAEAYRNMDWVERFEDRTIWTDMETKFGSTRVFMRPRPVGFGLRCNPNMHQVMKAAGVKDISAKVWGSRNPINVIKATCRMIQAGDAPTYMGNGLGGKGRRLDAGSGMKSSDVIALARGRKLISGRT